MSDEKILLDKECYKENRDYIMRLEEKNLYLKDELDKLKKKYDILNDKIKIYETQVCCGCCGVRWAVTMN